VHLLREVGLQQHMRQRSMHRVGLRTGLDCLGRPCCVCIDAAVCAALTPSLPWQHTGAVKREGQHLPSSTALQHTSHLPPGAASAPLVAASLPLHAEPLQRCARPSSAGTLPPVLLAPLRPAADALLHLPGPSGRPTASAQVALPKAQAHTG
jgi:hypothetical protein